MGYLFGGWQSEVELQQFIVKLTHSVLLTSISSYKDRISWGILRKNNIFCYKKTLLENYNYAK